MSSKNGGTIAAIVLLGTIVIIVISGILSWNWIEPEGFGGFILFMFIWGILSTIGHFIVMGLASMFSNK